MVLTCTGVQVWPLSPLMDTHGLLQLPEGRKIRPVGSAARCPVRPLHASVGEYAGSPLELHVRPPSRLLPHTDSIKRLEHQYRTFGYSVVTSGATGFAARMV